MLGCTGVAMRTLGLEFLPTLEEGNLYIRGTMPASISLEAGNPYVERMRKLIGSYPEVTTVVSHQGRPDDGTDATGFFNVEFFAPLKPADQWRPGLTKDKLIEQMSAQLREELPGIEFNFSQYIQDNVQEAASGVKGENSVKIYGTDLEQITRTAEDVKAALATVPGVTTDLAVFTSLGQPTVRIDIDRARAARYGLAPGDIATTISAAIGGQTAGDLYEYGSDRPLPDAGAAGAGLPPLARDDPQHHGRRHDGERRRDAGAAVGDRQVQLVSGAAFIYRENQERYIPVKFSVRGRDLGGAVIEAQRRVAEQVELPAGYHLEWVGEFSNLQGAIARLKLVVPVTIG